MTITEFINSLDQSEAKKIVCLLFDIRHFVKEKYPNRLDLFEKLMHHLDDDYQAAKAR
jgi:hypothetical protein